MTRPLTVVAAFLAIAGVASAQPPDSGPNVPVVVTSGVGVVTAAPDRAFVGLMTESRASAPREAQRQNAAAMAAVQDKLRAARVPKESIRTTMFTLQQEFDYRDGRQVSRGYVARHALEIRLDEIDRVGEIMDAAVASGATAVSNVRFDLKDRVKAEREALRLAVADARARAEAAAAGAGRAIDRVMKIEEARDLAPPRPFPMAMATRGVAAEQVTPVAEGELEIRSHVTLTASLK